MPTKFFSPGADKSKHVAELLDAVKGCAPRDSLMIDGDCHVYGYPHIASPIGISGKFVVHDA